MLPSADLQRLMADIKSGKCALVLGPEIFQVEGQSIQSFMREYLLHKYRKVITSFYERDGFFLIENPNDKPQIQDEVQHKYKELHPTETTLRQIVEIPFSLVLSTSPDTFLRDISIACGLPNRFAYFNAYKDEEFEIPDGYEADGSALRERIPMYYNLYGCVERPSTLVLDYDDLFRMLEGMLSAPKLPLSLLARLKETPSYLFLGFQFDHWHTQLLLKLLDVKNAARRFSFRSPLPKKDTKAFLHSQYRIDFFGDDVDLINQLYETFEKEGLLRPVNSLDTPVGQEITAFLQKGNLEKAIACLIDGTKGNSLSDQAILISARYQLWKEQKSKGTSTMHDLNVTFNQVCDSVLQIAKQL